MKKTAKRLKEFLKTILSGLIGAGIFFMFNIIAFGIAKIVFIIQKRDLIITRYNIVATILLFVLFGFAYGMSSYIKKNSYRKTMTPGWKNITIDIVISLMFTIITYIILKQKYYILLNAKSSLLVFALFLVLFYAFSALLTQIAKPPRTHKHKKRNIVWAILINPIFIMIFLGLFITVIYNSLYVPCGVTVVGVDKNINTANTQELDIKTGEKILKLDDTKINSLQDVKRYIASLKTTKEIVLETENNIYYIKTYQSENNRYMGLLLKQEYCPAE
jgi:heme/copper-type cytochrome/quinol oxidase subunit 2